MAPLPCSGGAVREHARGEGASALARQSDRPRAAEVLVISARQCLRRPAPGSILNGLPHPATTPATSTKGGTAPTGEAPALTTGPRRGTAPGGRAAAVAVGPSGEGTAPGGQESAVAAGLPPGNTGTCRGGGVPPRERRSRRRGNPPRQPAIAPGNTGFSWRGARCGGAWEAGRAIPAVGCTGVGTFDVRVPSCRFKDEPALTPRPARASGGR
ncbi:hypothetical protein GCM10020001_037890 [Nonomuraea salmonea]